MKIPIINIQKTNEYQIQNSNIKKEFNRVATREEKIYY